jgi:hypothetical protein
MIERNKHKHKINRPFYEHIKRVQGKDSLMFLVMDRTQIQPEIKMVYRLHISELPEHYKFYSFDLDSNLPSIYSE